MAQTEDVKFSRNYKKLLRTAPKLKEVIQNKDKFSGIDPFTVYVTCVLGYKAHDAPNIWRIAEQTGNIDGMAAYVQMLCPHTLEEYKEGEFMKYEGTGLMIPKQHKIKGAAIFVDNAIVHKVCFNRYVVFFDDYKIITVEKLLCLRRV
jgi:hypothetical protein